jgi:hypothetical protein
MILWGHLKVVQALGDGEDERDGEMGRWGDGEMGRKNTIHCMRYRQRRRFAMLKAMPAGLYTSSPLPINYYQLPI